MPPDHDVALTDPDVVRSVPVVRRPVPGVQPVGATGPAQPTRAGDGPVRLLGPPDRLPREGREPPPVRLPAPADPPAGASRTRSGERGRLLRARPAEQVLVRALDGAAAPAARRGTVPPAPRDDA